MRTLCAGILLVACAGADGEDGERGPRGADGDGVEFTARNATARECDNGGEVITFRSGDGSETITVCNGEDGDDGPAGPEGQQGPRGETGPEGDTGPMGPTGATGETGPVGMTGPAPDPADSLGKIEVAISCEGPLVGSGSLYAVHQATYFTDGSAFVFASISDQINQASASAFYAADTVGAVNTYVWMIFDVEGPNIGGTWTVTVNRDTLASTLEYADEDWPGGGQVWEQSVSDCLVREF